MGIGDLIKNINARRGSPEHRVARGNLQNMLITAGQMGGIFVIIRLAIQGLRRF